MEMDGEEEDLTALLAEMLDGSNVTKLASKKMIRFCEQMEIDTSGMEPEEKFKEPKAAVAKVPPTPRAPRRRNSASSGPREAVELVTSGPLITMPIPKYTSSLASARRQKPLSGGQLSSQQWKPMNSARSNFDGRDEDALSVKVDRYAIDRADDSMQGDFEDTSERTSGMPLARSTGAPLLPSSRGMGLNASSSFTRTAANISSMSLNGNELLTPHRTNEQQENTIPPSTSLASGRRKSRLSGGSRSSQQTMPGSVGTRNSMRHSGNTGSHAPSRRTSRTRQEKKKERDRINQKTYADKIKQMCKEAEKKIPEIKRAWQLLEKANSSIMNTLNNIQLRKIEEISMKYDRKLKDSEVIVQHLKAELVEIRPRLKKLNKKPNTINNKVFRTKQTLILKRWELEKLRFEKQKIISDEIEKLIRQRMGPIVLRLNDKMSIASHT